MTFPAKHILFLVTAGLAPLAIGCSGDASSLLGSGTPGSSRSTSATSGNDSSSSAGDAPAPTGQYAAELVRCVDETNAYRTSIGRTPYKRSSALEDFAGKAASSDSQTSTAHGYFSKTRGGGIAFAENAVPGWPLRQYGEVSKVIVDGLKMMWDEGPGGGHYENMSSTKYTEMGCGIVVTGANEVWVVQDFR